MPTATGTRWCSFSWGALTIVEIMDAHKGAAAEGVLVMDMKQMDHVWLSRE